MVRRGRAATSDMGVQATVAELAPELTITSDGAFWSPFVCSVRKVTVAASGI